MKHFVLAAVFALIAFALGVIITTTINAISN